jgi:hypothetical protein
MDISIMKLNWINNSTSKIEFVMSWRKLRKTTSEICLNLIFEDYQFKKMKDQ